MSYSVGFAGFARCRASFWNESAMLRSWSDEGVNATIGWIGTKETSVEYVGEGD